jgi:hypothetical protein
VIKRFSADNLVVNLDKNCTAKFLTTDSKFLGLQIDNHINQKNHIEQMIPKLNASCYVIRSTVHISNINTPKSIYCA